MNLTEHISHSNFPVFFVNCWLAGLFVGIIARPFMLFFVLFVVLVFCWSCFARKCFWSWLSVRKFSGHESQRNISWFPLETELLSSSKISIFSIWSSFTQMLRNKFLSRAIVSNFLFLGSMPRNFKISTIKPKLSFLREQIPKLIIRVNLWFLTNSTYTWFPKFSTKIAIIGMVSFWKNVKFIYRGIRKNPKIHSSYHFCDFSSKMII